MPNPLLTLGTFSFEGLESPDRIVLKNRQRLVVHHLGSGLSKVDSLGGDCQIASFRGIFSGTEAPARIREIDLLRTAGLPCFLTWESQSLSVLIEEFELNYLSSQWVTYRLSCRVVQSVDFGVGDLLDPIYASAASLASDLASLLGETSVAATTGQMASVVVLATANYDVAPRDSLGPAQLLLSTIDSGLPADSGGAQGLPPEGSNIAGPTYGSLANLVAGFGQTAYLLLARNRLLSIVVQAKTINLR